MSLAAGARLGVYEVVGLIGLGGMGEVYRGRDPRLGRDVALKILPELFSVDPDRLARFKREAQVLAALNHSNIASIYGFEESGRVQALVLELVEGPTLADRISHGPIPLDDALSIAGQIAAGLEGAHERGIIHRDLKPANIKVRPDGTVKVLDFGLAKALAGDASTPDASHSPTITSPALTRMGVMLGTAAYMSPEQTRGKPLDKRSDIWAFGWVLYEMLAGRRAFGGDDVSLTLANVLKSDPDWTALPPDTPDAMTRVVRRCLEKDPKRRYHDIADARLDLDERAATGTRPSGGVEGKRGYLERLLWAFAVGALAVFLGYALLKDSPRQPLLRFQVDPPANTFFGSALGGAGGATGASSGTVSPDGTRLVFVATDTGGRTNLWVHPFDSFTARPLPGTDGASLPFWSPDSRFIGFFAAGKLKKIDALGGTLHNICDIPGAPRGGSWGIKNVIVFSSTGSAGVARVPADGGQIASATTVADVKQTAHYWPSFLPDGQHFLFSVHAPAESERGIFIGSLEPGAVRRLIAGDTNAIYAAPGFILFMRRGTLLRQRFDPDRLVLAADEPSRVIERVPYSPEYGLGAFSASATGVLTFRSDAPDLSQLAWFDRGGRLVDVVAGPGRYRTPTLSPDETRVAFSSAPIQGPDIAGPSIGDIYVLDLSRKRTSRLTFNPGSGSPVWFPDGSRIAYRSAEDGGTVFEKDANGAGAERLLLKAAINGPSQITTDGRFLVFFAVSSRDGTQGNVVRALNRNIYLLPLTGERKPIPVLEDTPYTRNEPELSPDGHWLAYSSDETGRNEVWVQPYPPTGFRRQVSTSGGRQPQWRRDGKELFFVSDDRKLYAADVTTQPVFEATARFLFDLRANVFNTGKSYAPSRDGQRFLVNMLVDNPSPINVILNWAPDARE